jgi:hypothetical protein
MAKRTKSKRAATGRSRSRSKRSLTKASGRKPAARRSRAKSARSGKAKPARSGERASTSSPGQARSGSASSGAARRRRRTDVEAISERGSRIVEIPTDPARFDSDPPDMAEQAREVANAMVGDEAPGGTVMVPEHDAVDQYAAALGVERSPDSPVRSSEEILHERDDRRRPGGPDREAQRRTI